MEKFLSIIIPMYNSANYINKTLESLNNVTDKDFEVIVIDDGSTDHSLKVAENCLNKMDIGYKILRESHRGQSYARNKGIENAKGKYLLFLDSDDFVKGNLVEVIKKSVIEETEILVYDYLRVKSDYEIIENKEQEFNYSGIHSFGVEIFKAYKNNKLRLWTGALIYNREFLNKNKIKFLEGAYGAEDLNFIFKALFKANNTKVIKDELVFYYQRENSLTNNPDIKKNITVIESMEDLMMFMKNNGISTEYIEAIETEFLPEHIMYQILGALKSTTKAEVKEVLKKTKAKTYLKGMKKESSRYGKSVCSWARMIVVMPTTFFVNLYINKTGK